MNQANEITQVLQLSMAGDEKASVDLLPLVYEELRSLAERQMAMERANHTLQATALVHDAYLRLVGSTSGENWDSRGHFYAAAAKSIRRILIEHARSKARMKRGGDRIRIDLIDLASPAKEITSEHLLELDDALTKLEQCDGEVAELVRLRLYAGLSVGEAAKALKISRTVAYERWDYALSWFSVELSEH